ncbi:MAG: hypothetical protein RXN89_04765 [Vulcanisaeta sp.]|jgi:hypothetical protein|uniref:hypothetical protein n=1 Tax=Vulcanisaeta sp. EB80 TaxID=1650660 RepID=UPI0009BE17B8|nr:hypothetical protein [Vulcanisaeta sp. EB80]MCG2865455.1 hypothetical protein [Vulcanisaeta sp.]MCG2867505.1 hypothetical protein [Vulcanisaeta sp.]MCG2886234.1 hypothetical protein [Vulcanisaeta sp.]PLC67066.1 hypothetical protein B7L70_09365 [Vulcanisaeta sp. EB80]
MLAYIDYPEWRKLIESTEELDALLSRNMRQALSLIVMIGGDYDDSINSTFLKVWNGLTGNKGFIEDVHALSTQYRRGLIKADELTIGIINLLNKRRFSLVDLIMMSNYMKLVNDINLLDLGLMVLYENPESILAGAREPPDIIPNRILSRELELDLEARCMVVKRTFSVHVSRQYDSNIYVIDWSNPGVVPYSKFAVSRVGDVEVSDPVFSSFVRFRVRVVSKVMGKDFVLTLPKPLNINADMNYCSSNVFVSLPQSMNMADYLSLVGKLRGLGYNVRITPFTRVDELIEDCSGGSLS